MGGIDFMEALFSAIVSFFVFHFASHPKSKLHKKLPKKKLINRVQILPSIHIEAKNRIIHLHHWMNFTAIFVALNYSHQPIHSQVINGFLIGAIIQGLLYANRFKIVFRYDEYHRKVRCSSYNLSFLKKLV